MLFSSPIKQQINQILEMPRRKSAQKRKAEPEVPNEKPDDLGIRDFLDPESVSQHLFCSICQEVFVNPHRAPCGHSYCKICIETWLANSPSCPEDRKPLLPKDLHHDFILENIIMDQKVACPHRILGCSNVGPLSVLRTHMKECSFNPSVMPGFLKDEMIKLTQNDEKNEEGELEATYLPLKMRIYQAGGSQRENLMKAFDKSDDSTEKLRRLMDLIEDD